MPWFWFQIASLLVISERIVLRKIWEVHLVVQWSILPSANTSLNLTWALREWGDPRAKIGPIWIWPLFQSQVKIGVSLWHMRSFTSDCIITCTRFLDLLMCWTKVLKLFRQRLKYPAVKMFRNNHVRKYAICCRGLKNHSLGPHAIPGAL